MGIMVPIAVVIVIESEGGLRRLGSEKARAAYADQMQHVRRLY